jgi:hypothetical protein
MDIGEQLGEADNKLAELLATKALLATDVVHLLDNLSSGAAALVIVASAGMPQADHAVLGETADKPDGVEDTPSAVW